MGFITNEIPESLTDYNAYKGFTNATAFATHVRAYNLWWAQNIPYFDSPEPAIKKNYYYRWWLMRFNNLDANMPGQTFQFPTSVEGALGLQQRHRADPAHAHRRPEVPAQPALRVRRLAVRRPGLQERPVPRQPG